MSVMRGTDYLITKLEAGPLEIRRDPSEFPSSENFVIAILGLTDEELERRNEDIRLLINKVRGDSTKAVTLVLYDAQIKESRVFTHTVPDIGDVTVVALLPLKFVRDPGLNDAMEASYLLSRENGKQVDYALSDYSSPAWRFTHLMHSQLIPYIKRGGKMFLHSPSYDDPMRLQSGGQYPVGDPTRLSYVYAKEDRPATLSVEKTVDQSPLPHYARDGSERPGVPSSRSTGGGGSLTVDRWECSACTFINDSGTKCDMCESRRPGVPSSRSTGGGGFKDRIHS
jgi:hypothetical protein